MSRTTRLTLVTLLLICCSAVPRAGQTAHGSPAANACVSPQGGTPQWGLYFVANAELVIDEVSESPLDRLGDQELAWVAPLSHEPAVKVQSEASRRILLGDVDPAVPWLYDWGDLDALALRSYGVLTDRPVFDDFIVSVEQKFAHADEGSIKDIDGAVDGSLFRVTRSGTGAPQLDFFMTEAQIVTALGHDELTVTNGVDVDAFMQDSWGNIFLSFRTDELVVGTLVGDAALVCIPRTAITYDGDVDVQSVIPSSAVVVWDDAMADAFAENAALVTATGKKIDALGDLQAVTLDPAGGTFAALQAIPGLGHDMPNVLFAGQSVGASVLSTRDGGSPAIIDGVALAEPVIHGGALGLAPDATAATTDDLNALALAAIHRPQACLDTPHGAVMLGVENVVLHGAGFTPDDLVVLLIDVEPASPQLSAIPSLPAPAWAGYRHLFMTGPLAVLLQADSEGRAAWQSAPWDVGAPDIATWVRAQMWSLGDGQLSTPVSVWCATP